MTPVPWKHFIRALRVLYFTGLRIGVVERARVGNWKPNTGLLELSSAKAERATTARPAITRTQHITDSVTVAALRQLTVDHSPREWLLPIALSENGKWRSLSTAIGRAARHLGWRERFPRLFL